jgi:hypothetical protein
MANVRTTFPALAGNLNIMLFIDFERKYSTEAKLIEDKQVGKKQKE